MREAGFAAVFQEITLACSPKIGGFDMLGSFKNHSFRMFFMSRFLDFQSGSLCPNRKSLVCYRLLSTQKQHSSKHEKQNANPRSEKTSRFPASRDLRHLPKQESMEKTLSKAEKRRVGNTYIHSCFFWLCLLLFVFLGGRGLTNTFYKEYVRVFPGFWKANAR